MGWFATESMNGDNGIVLTLLPGTTEEFFTNLNSLSNNEIMPVTHLVIQDKEDLKERLKPPLCPILSRHLFPLGVQN